MLIQEERQLPNTVAWHEVLLPEKGYFSLPFILKGL